jgi:hypothetical protein
MKRSIGTLAILSLAACAQLPAPVGNWIELPLEENTFAESSIKFKTGTYEIPVRAQQALEFQVNILENDTITYKWDVEMADPDNLDVEFHGHTNRVGDEPGLLMFYKIHNEGQGEGALTAPFSGIHGWYLNNKSDNDIVVKLVLSGFYTELEEDT